LFPSHSTQAEKTHCGGAAQHFLDTVNGCEPKGKSSRVEWMPGMLIGNAFRYKYLEVDQCSPIFLGMILG
jgi:hypothetical protein